MNYLAILDSGNYVFNLCRNLEKKGYVFEIVATPCHIAKGGCGYCLRFPAEFRDVVLSEAISLGTPVREMYRVLTTEYRQRYERII